jgi:ABC-type transporter Mla maintaining outer membrane lipid asymmetry ATPase subunit MlaF/ABC-type transporter Mla maintaining outer membrane lipid asymmetry permease subunit MlaE
MASGGSTTHRAHCAGPSGAGKTRTMMHVMGVQHADGLDADVSWDPRVPPSERCGILFQQGALINSLSVVENMLLSLGAACATAGDGGGNAAGGASTSIDGGAARVKQLLDAVGITASDHHKMPDELSGGMLRRVALAQLLAQRKRLILLDEPFIGLDPATATGIAKELSRLKREENTAFILISHQQHYVDMLVPEHTAHITPRHEPSSPAVASRGGRSNHRLLSRVTTKVWDYLGYSIPLIVCAAIAAGFAICMLLADVLIRTDVTDNVLQVLEDELSGDDIPEMVQAMAPLIKLKARALIEERAPVIKAMLYSKGVAKLFVLELGPLLTALLLAGRIGGSYAGEVAMMTATNQNRLLKTLGVSPRRWTLGPSLAAAALAGPLLTMLATAICLLAGGVVAVLYGLEDDAYAADYFDDVWAATVEADGPWQTYPPIVMVYRSVAFIFVTMAVAEISGRWDPLLQSRDVPWVITTAVVVSSLGIIFLDWAFSQVLLRY